MKSDEVVYAELEKESNNLEIGEAPTQNPRFMIAGEAPILLGKACEMLVKELSIRAWKHTERNRRRTLQKQDVHAAVGESEVYDFLIDIVPRVQMQPAVKGFAPPIPSVQEPVQQVNRLTSSVVNEIPTINHAPQVHAPATQGAQSQPQQMMPQAQMQAQNASHQSQLQQMTPQAQMQAQNASHQSQLQQMMPQAQIQAQNASHQSQLQQMMPQAQIQAQYTILQQQQQQHHHRQQQHDSGNHHYQQQQQQHHHQQQQQYVGNAHNIEGNKKT